MDAALAERLGRLLGSKPASWEHRAAPWQPLGAVAGGTQRYRVRLADGRRVFVKYAPGGEMARWLRREQQVYAHLRGSFVPAVLASEGGESPLLVLEDLTEGHWPPPWRSGDVDAVLLALAAVAASPPPPDTPKILDYEVELATGWQRVAADPDPFLSLGLAPRDWLDRALPALIEASRAARLDGDDLVHLDVRSDNLCFRGGDAVLVDWNHTCLGNAAFDVAFLLPSLAAEGGPQPYELLTGAGELAAVVSGYFASRAGLPPPAFAPTVRPLQLVQLVPALAWTRRELEL